MICTRCGKNNNDASAYCIHCGQDLRQQGTAQSQMQQNRMPQAQASQQVSNVQQRNTAYGNQEMNHSYAAQSDTILIEPNEQIVASLSNSTLDNILHGVGIKTEYAVLSNKRFYYQGKRGLLNITTEKSVINLEDITGTGIAAFNPWGTLIVGAVIAMWMLIMSLGLGRMAGGEGMGGFGIFAMLIVAAFTAYSFYRKKTSFLVISYAGGSIKYDVKKFNENSVKDFQSKIYMLKERCKR